MKISAIELSHLPEGKQGLKGTLAAELIQSRFDDNSEVSFSTPVQFEAELIFRGNELRLTGRVSGSFNQVCGKCLEQTTQAFNETINLHYRLSDRGYEELASDELLLESTIFNLEEALIDSCLLQVHPFEVPHEDCRPVSTDKTEQGGSMKLSALLNAAMNEK